MALTESLCTQSIQASGPALLAQASGTVQIMAYLTSPMVCLTLPHLHLSIIVWMIWPLPTTTGTHTDTPTTGTSGTETDLWVRDTWETFCIIYCSLHLVSLLFTVIKLYFRERVFSSKELYFPLTSLWSVIQSSLMSEMNFIAFYSIITWTMNSYGRVRNIDYPFCSCSEQNRFLSRCTGNLWRPDFSLYSVHVATRTIGLLKGC